MAKENLAVASDNSAPAEGEVKKRTRKSGPRTAKPTYVLFRVTDATGSPIEGAKLEVILATKDTEQVMNALDDNKDAIRTKISL